MRRERNTDVFPSQSMTLKKTGVRKIPNAVTPSMPLKTAVPRVRRISAPAPWAINRGSEPRMNAAEVITIGRKRSLQAAKVASCRGAPSSRWCLANSTIRIAFLLARPTSTTKPICVKMLMSAGPPLAIDLGMSMGSAETPTIAHNRHMGTTRITAKGSDQLSYCAASTRKTINTDTAKMAIAVLPACTSKNAISVHS